MKYLFLIGTALAVSTPAFAQEAATGAPAKPADDRITVLATGSATSVDTSSQPIAVIGTAEIDSVQGPDVARVLQRLPGVTITRSGSLGSATSLFVRGANSQQLLVMVDGVRVADVSGTSGGYDFGNLMTGSIGKIELLRGSNSVVWGSDAIGGVLNITSRDVNGVEASAEYGSRNTFDGQVTAGISGDTYGVTLDGGYTRTDGFSQAAVGTENDGFHQWRVGGRGHVELTPDLVASLTGHYSQGRLEIDGYPAPDYTFGDTNDYQKTREIDGRGALDWTGDTLSMGVAYQLSDTRRRYYGDSDSFYDGGFLRYQGQSRRAELTGSWKAWRDLRVDFGADHEWSHADNNEGTDEGRHYANLSSGHALVGWYSPVVNLAAGVRYDHQSRFGGAWTFGGNGSVALGHGWRVIASYGEGFKAPSLYQLFSAYGNADLKAERSRSYDAGLEYGDRNGPLYFAVTGFRRDTRNLIDFVDCAGAECVTRPYGLYANIGRARATGVELELGAQVSPALHAQAVYTYTKSVNRTEGNADFGDDLARRPRNALTLSLDWTSPFHGLALGADLRMVSDSFDDAANATRLDGWATGTVRASLPITKTVEAFARVENVTNEKYEVVSGYNTERRSVFGGVRVKM